MFLIALAVLAASPATFESAFAAAKPGDTLRLIPGRYPLTIIRSRTFSPPLTVDASAATMTGIVLRDTSGIRWTGGVFDGSTLTVKSATDFGFAAYTGRNITVTGVAFSALRVGVVLDHIVGGEVSNSSFVGMRADGIDLAGVELRRPTLDDVFLTLTGRSLRDGEPTDGPADRPATSDGAAA